RLALARKMGADEVVNLGEVDPVAAVRELTDGGADFVYEVAGSARALDQAIGMARKGGAVVMLTVHREVQVNLEPAVRGELHLMGAICYSYREYERALALLTEWELDVDPLLAHVFPLARAPEAFEFVLTRQGLVAAFWASPAVAQSRQETLIIARNIDDYVTNDVHRTYEYTSQILDTAAYDTLVTVDAPDFTKIQPRLATSWTVSPDGTAYTF